MERTLFWIDGDASGWACSVCRWRFPVPTLLSEQEAREAYDRLAAAKFEEHTCETQTGLPAATQKATLYGNISLAERARMFIKRGYKPKDAGWRQSFRKEKLPIRYVGRLMNCGSRPPACSRNPRKPNALQRN
jgi:hypothetical protein